MSTRDALLQKRAALDAEIAEFDRRAKEDEALERVAEACWDRKTVWVAGCGFSPGSGMHPPARGSPDNTPVAYSRARGVIRVYLSREHALKHHDADMIVAVRIGPNGTGELIPLENRKLDEWEGQH